MNILFVAQTDPRETAYGGQQRTHALWMGLRSIPGATVKMIVPVARKYMEKEDVDAGIYHLCFERRYSVGWFAQRILKRLIPYWDCSWAYNWKLMHSRFSDCDVVVSRYIAPVAAFKLWRLAPLYVDADDIHTLEYDAETKVRGNSLRRMFVRYLLGRFQASIYVKACQIWVPAQEHVKLLEGIPVSYLPNVPCGEIPDFSNVLGNKDRLLFVGYMCTDPNIMAVDWFLKTFWQDIKHYFPTLEFYIVGSGLQEKYAVEWSGFTGVHVLGWVADIYTLYKNSLAVVTPMRIGMGSCIKVLESLRIGRCVISTRRGLRGIDMNECIPGNGIYLFDDLDGLVAGIQSLLDERERLRAQTAAHNFSTERFSQKGINEILLSTIGNK